MAKVGDFLVAAPVLRDENFFRSVVLLCVEEEEGAVGLVINRPLDIDVSHFISDMRGKSQLHFGGPVKKDVVSYLHRHGDRVRSALPVMPGVFFSGRFEDIQTLIRDEEASYTDCRFFAGFSSWGPGQLDSEISEGSWFVTRAVRELVFSARAQDLWSAVLRRMGGEYAMLANFPLDPSLN
ncbi:MAG: YqgE/AlgH family protein [Bacteroidota bacterium]|nr:YqgE/AlgH family protein [Bacteroidota bacterium]